MSEWQEDLMWICVIAACVLVVVGTCSGCARVSVPMTFPDQIAQLDDDDCGDDPICPLEYANFPVGGHVGVCDGPAPACAYGTRALCWCSDIEPYHGECRWFCTSDGSNRHADNR